MEVSGHLRIRVGEEGGREGGARIKPSAAGREKEDLKGGRK